LTEKYLFSIEVEPYKPNRQLSIINSHRGVPRYHFPINGRRGVLVAMVDFDTASELEQEYDWVKDVHKGYYRVIREIKS
jgi:hypothetical protein